MKEKKKQLSKAEEAAERGMRRVTIDLPEKLCEAVDEEAGRLGLKFSQVIRVWLSDRMVDGGRA